MDWLPDRDQLVFLVFIVFILAAALAQRHFRSLAWLSDDADDIAFHEMDRLLLADNPSGCTFILRQLLLMLVILAVGGGVVWLLWQRAGLGFDLGLGGG